MALMKRKDVNFSHTWDLNHLFETEKAFNETLSKTYDEVVSFNQRFEGRLSDSDTIIKALKTLAYLQESITKLGSYVSLHMAVDQSNEGNLMRTGHFQMMLQKIEKHLTFVLTELKSNDENILIDAAKKELSFANYLQKILDDKKHTLSYDVEKALQTLSPVLNAPYQNYSRTKLTDMKFPNFIIDGKRHQLSFVLFENEYEYNTDHKVRRTSYLHFYRALSLYQHGLASNYQSEVMKQKGLATLKGFDSVIDYLLYPQQVTKDMYDRQIDIIMEDFAYVARKYAELLKKVHGLDKLTYADLKLPLDPEFEPMVSIEEARKYMVEGLSPLGSEYIEMVNRSFDERWIDFPQNIGKSTGAFCQSPYGSHPYILISWTNRMREAFVLAHELGHAGHFYLSHQTQNIFNARPSLYFIEAPSTMNELLMGDYLLKKAKDKRFKRWVLSSVFSRTYYHNFVTHLLEASYQREVYRRIDQGKPITTNILNKLTHDTLKKFWGDTVDIDPIFGLTWIRQPHYFMGLYPYTYSAGLTISTVAYQNIQSGKITLDDWKNVLKSGGTKDPVELAKMAGVDIETDQALSSTIEYLNGLVDEMITLTEELS